MRRFNTVAAMSGDEPKTEGGDAASQRARLAVALGATFLLFAIVGIVLASRGSDEPPSVPTGACFVAWNEDPTAPRQTGIHAYIGHGYRQTLVTRLDRNGNIVESPNDDLAPDDPDASCALIFAAPQVDEEPEFGVRVFTKNALGEESGWTSLSIKGGTKLEDIAVLQAEAVTTSNALILSDGLLAEE